MKFKKLIAIFFAMVFALSLPLSTFAAAKDEIPDPPSYKEHLPYYYHQLETKEQKQMYLTFRKAIINHQSSVTITSPDIKLTFLHTMCEMFFYNDDYTFNLTQVSFNKLDNKDVDGVKNEQYRLSLKYRVGKNAYRQMIPKVDKTVEDFIATIPEDMGGFSKVLKIHDFVVSSCDYDMVYEYCFIPYGALVYGKALCEGYARSINYICNELGINSVMLVSDPVSGEVYGHAWNKVQIGDNWYILDATNNDWQLEFNSSITRDFIFLADDEFTLAIEKDQEGIEEPKATDYDHSYYEQMGLEFATVKEALAYVKKNLTKQKRPYSFSFVISDDQELKKLEDDFVKTWYLYTGIELKERKDYYLVWWYRNTVHMYFGK